MSLPFTQCCIKTPTKKYIPQKDDVRDPAEGCGAFDVCDEPKIL